MPAVEGRVQTCLHAGFPLPDIPSTNTNVYIVKSPQYSPEPSGLTVKPAQYFLLQSEALYAATVRVMSSLRGQLKQGQYLEVFQRNYPNVKFFQICM